MIVTYYVSSIKMKGCMHNIHIIINIKVISNIAELVGQPAMSHNPMWAGSLLFVI